MTENLRGGIFFDSHCSYTITYYTCACVDWWSFSTSGGLLPWFVTNGFVWFWLLLCCFPLPLSSCIRTTAYNNAPHTTISTLTHHNICLDSWYQTTAMIVWATAFELDEIWCVTGDVTLICMALTQAIRQPRTPVTSRNTQKNGSSNSGAAIADASWPVRITTGMKATDAIILAANVSFS